MSLQDLENCTDRQLISSEVPLAAAVEKNVAIYDCAAHGAALIPGQAREALKAEICANLLNGSGAVVLKGAFRDAADDWSAAGWALPLDAY